MKKLLTTITAVAATLTVSSCGGSAKYPYENLGVYDTEKEQYISIGDSLNRVKKIYGTELREDTTNPKEIMTVYNNTLYSFYNTDNEIIAILLPLTSSDSLQYTMPGELTALSTADDFTKGYKYVYVADYGNSKSYYVFLKATGKDEYEQLSKAAMEQIDIFTDKSNEIYMIKLGTDEKEELNNYSIINLTYNPRNVADDREGFNKYLDRMTEVKD